MVTKTLEDHLYWCGVYSRWIRDDTWPEIKAAFFGRMPFLMQKIIPTLARRDMKSSLKAHGMGRHSDAEIRAFSRRTLQSLAVLLGDKTYFFGERVSTLDVTAFGFLAQFILIKLDNDFIQDAREYENLVAYCQRFQAEYYPEFV